MGSSLKPEEVRAITSFAWTRTVDKRPRSGYPVLAYDTPSKVSMMTYDSVNQTWRGPLGHAARTAPACWVYLRDLQPSFDLEDELMENHARCMSCNWRGHHPLIDAPGAHCPLCAANVERVQEKREED